MTVADVAAGFVLDEALCDAVFDAHGLAVHRPHHFD
jgi:hypothetical protein